MYGYLPMAFKNLFALSKFLGTLNINLNNWESEGCETCDYGSKYAHVITWTYDD